MNVLRDIHMCFNIFLTISFIVTLIGKPELYANAVHVLLLWTPVKSVLSLVTKIIAKITGKNIHQMTSKINELVAEVWKNLVDVDDFRSNGREENRTGSPSNRENEASVDKTNTEEKDAKSDNDDNCHDIDADVNASCSNETKVAGHDANDDGEPSDRMETIPTFCEKLGNCCVLSEKLNRAPTSFGIFKALNNMIPYPESPIIQNLTDCRKYCFIISKLCYHFLYSSFWKCNTPISYVAIEFQYLLAERCTGLKTIFGLLSILISTSQLWRHYTNVKTAEPECHYTWVVSLRAHSHHLEAKVELKYHS